MKRNHCGTGLTNYIRLWMLGLLRPANHAGNAASQCMIGIVIADVHDGDLSPSTVNFTTDLLRNVADNSSYLFHYKNTGLALALSNFQCSNTNDGNHSAAHFNFKGETAMYKSMTMAVAVLALAVTGTAFAQSPAGNSAQSTKMSTMHNMHVQHLQRHLANLKARLKITSSQESAWDGYVQALQNRYQKNGNSETKQSAANLTVPEMANAKARRAQQRAQNEQALAAAADNLYGRLTSDQQTAWNQYVAERHPGMCPVGHHSGMMHGSTNSKN